MLNYCYNSYRKDYDNQKDPFFISHLNMDDNILRRMPPVRIFCGSSDPLRDESVLFTQKLR